MKVRRMLTPMLGAALFFSLGAFAQDSGASAGQNSSAQSQSANSGHHKKSGAKSGSSAMDKKFVDDAAKGGLAEVDLGNLAKSNASNDAVKQFGDKMVTDHSKANDELKDLAQKKGWNLPSEPKPADKAKKDRLAKLNGAQFDKAYIRDMVMDHEKDVKEFKKCAASCKDPDLKQWASNTVPTLEEHLKMAKDAAQQVGALSKKSASSHKSHKGTSGTNAKPSGAIQ